MQRAVAILTIGTVQYQIDKVVLVRVVGDPAKQPGFWHLLYRHVWRRTCKEDGEILRCELAH